MIACSSKKNLHNHHVKKICNNKKISKQIDAQFYTMQANWENFIIDLIKKNQEFGFFTQMFMATHLIPFQIIAFESLKIICPSTYKRKWKDACVIHPFELFK
jgi:hypothetical protein